MFRSRLKREDYGRWWVEVAGSDKWRSGFVEVGVGKDDRGEREGVSG